MSERWYYWTAILVGVAVYLSYHAELSIHSIPTFLVGAACIVAPVVIVVEGILLWRRWY